MTDQQILEWAVEELRQGRRITSYTIRMKFGVGGYKSTRLANLAKRIANVAQPERFMEDHNVDQERYLIERMVVNEWGQPGHTNKQIKIWLRPKGAELAQEVRKSLEENPPIQRVSVSLGDNKRIALLGIFDLHVGMLAWHKEVGESYDTEKAIERLNEATSSLLSRVSDLDSIIIPIGNDILHADTHRNTTASGTQLDVDSRWQKAFAELVDALIRGPLSWAAEIAPTRVVVVPGNHDYQRSFYLGEVLKWYFEGRKLKVHVDNAPRPRKYLMVGNVLFGFTHGHSVKMNDLATLMAVEAPKEWGEATWREWVLGHYHAKREIRTLTYSESGGVRMRIMPSLASHDAWHYENGLVTRKSEATLTIYDPSDGPIEEHYYRPRRFQ
jgi:predicted phosphodiesterase